MHSFINRYKYRKNFVPGFNFCLVIQFFDLDFEENLFLKSTNMST